MIEWLDMQNEAGQHNSTKHILTLTLILKNINSSVLNHFPFPTFEAWEPDVAVIDHRIIAPQM